MAGINIPGVTDQYNTASTIEKLMEVERIPLNREQKTLDGYKAEKDAWRDVNKSLSSLRDSVKTLYSYENPFNNKLTESSEASAVTAEAGRAAELQSFKIDVIQPATADRLLSSELEANYKVPAGVYTFKVGEKQLTINWKGGTLKEFSTSVNKRGKNIVNTMIIGASAGRKTLLLESLETGKDNKLIFEGAALDFAKEIGMITPVLSEAHTFGTEKNEINPVRFSTADNEQKNMPSLSVNGVSFEEDSYVAAPRSSFKVNVPSNVKNDSDLTVKFSVKAERTTDITVAINEKPAYPEFQSSGFASFSDIIIENEGLDSQIKIPETQAEPLNPIESEDVIYAIMNDGSERLIETKGLLQGEKEITLPLQDYQGISSIAVKNRNTGVKITLSKIEAYNPNAAAGYKPLNAISEADDAIIKYEGITIRREKNDIDDVVPEITLHLHDKTEKTAILTVKADVESSKNALINFVGKYNQTIAQLNVLSQTNEEIINELDYLTDDEVETMRNRLGLFQTDFSLSSIKSNLSSILNTSYAYSDDAVITMLNQIGISTNASGTSGSYSQSRLRGYLEIDEKKLDSALENHLDDIKAMFGYDSDGDLIIDTGIAYNVDKQVSAYTQTGGILSMKTSSLDSKIKSSESRISKLEDQMNQKEADYKKKYGAMEGSLNSLESQQNAITNFTKQQQRNSN
ncbi:MAG: flagellar filament capping protein FliD [Treponema sp.]|nr:flagellar filament capping protein FliD [Treponema sp.]